ncbi:MAG TPA: trypsin-like peptidase domain-containing protein [Terriglobia bacterium]
MKRPGHWPVLMIAGTLGIGILIGTLISHGVRAAKPARSDARLLGAPSPPDLSNSFARVADAVDPAVVNIKTETDVRVGRAGLGRRRHSNPDGPDGEDQDGSPLDGLFDHFFHFGGPPGSIPESSLGSGVILDASGYILTNCHVIMREGGDRPADRMRVVLAGEDDTAKGHPARVVGFDKWTDLAVIKVDTLQPLAVATFGNSDAVRVGDWVLAVGSPFGLNSTVTAGIISAKGRGIEAGRDGEFKHFIQTDAAINPGNSGGPLVNLGGQVIGINTAIATDRDGYDGVGFAIPSNTARKIYNDIVAAGQVRRGAIGVSFVSGRNDSVLAAMGTDRGVVVESVTPDSPAEHAGLRLGDVINSVDSKPTPTGDDLLAVISDAKPGTKLRIGLVRDGKPMSVDVVVGDWNTLVADADEPPAKSPQTIVPVDNTHGSLGLSVKNLTSEQARSIARDVHLTGPEGVVVVDAKPGGFADELGLERFDVILSINHQNILSVDDFDRIQAGLKSGQSVLFLLARESETGFTTQFLADKLP